MKNEKKHSAFNKGLVILAWLLIVAGAGLTLRYYLFAHRFISTNNAQVDQHITPVSSKVPGFIREIRFKENQFVHQGDTLVVLDNREYLNKLDMAHAELRALNDNIDINQTEVKVQDGHTAVQSGRLDAAKVQLWKTEKDYNRFKNLLAEEAATAQQFDQARAAYEVARAQVKTIEQEQQAAALKSKALSAQTRPEKTSLKSKEAQLNNASLYLSYTVVTAPYDGWVGKQTIQIGQLVKEGQTLVHLVSQEKWITANFRETQIAPLQVGTEVLIKADAYPDEEFHGKIASFSPASGSKFSMLPQDNANGNFVKIEQRIPVRIEFNAGEASDKLRAGMNVYISARR